MVFEEVDASSLVKIDLPSPYEVNQAGYMIHSAVHGARNVRCA
jgi:ribulose-5-phosphate 4-epimerase/fuculose-1-phosphate aldolase